MSGFTLTDLQMHLLSHHGYAPAHRLNPQEALAAHENEHDHPHPKNDTHSLDDRSYNLDRAWQTLTEGAAQEAADNQILARGTLLVAGELERLQRIAAGAIGASRTTPLPDLLQMLVEDRARILRLRTDAIFDLVDLKGRLAAVADEYDRVPRQLSSGAIASMLREWTEPGSAGHLPMRGSDVEAWIKNRRDLYEPGDPGYFTLDALLDDYRLHADTGTPLTEEVQGPEGDR